MQENGTRVGRRRTGAASLAIGFVAILAGCTSGSANAPGWTFGRTLSAPSDGASAARGSPVAASVSAPSAAPASPAAVAQSALPGASQAAADGSAKPFSGRMTPQVLLVGGYVTMYIELDNTGSEPLTFLNTLYDIEPDKLYNPTVAFPYESGETAVVTRAGRFFPSPAIIQPGQKAVYVMGGIQARGTGVMATPVANIKFCPTRGMDDIPSVPIQVSDVLWSTSGDVTTVRGTLAETEGSRRPDPPIVGIAFFDKAGAFVGAVVDSRNGDRMQPHSSRRFEMEGRGVDGARIFRAEAYAFVS
jgi:hypothetical protein